MSEPIRVGLVVDVRLYREGLMSSLASHPQLKVVGAASASSELRALLQLRPDVVVLDVATHDSHTIAQTVARELPEAKIIGFGVAEVDREVLACAANGLAGYVPCEASLDGLVSVIESVTRDELPCSPRAASMLFRQVGALSTETTSPADPRLTGREHQIVELIDRAFSNKEIAHTLNVELSTVKNHVHNILEKLQVSRRSEAAARIRKDRRMVKADLVPGARSAHLRTSKRERYSDHFWARGHTGSKV